MNEKYNNGGEGDVGSNGTLQDEAGKSVLWISGTLLPSVTLTCAAQLKICTIKSGTVKGY